MMCKPNKYTCAQKMSTYFIRNSEACKAGVIFDRVCVTRKWRTDLNPFHTTHLSQAEPCWPGYAPTIVVGTVLERIMWKSQSKYNDNIPFGRLFYPRWLTVQWVPPFLMRVSDTFRNWSYDLDIASVTLLPAEPHIIRASKVWSERYCEKGIK